MAINKNNNIIINNNNNNNNLKRQAGCYQNYVRDKLDDSADDENRTRDFGCQANAQSDDSKNDLSPKKQL